MLNSLRGLLRTGKERLRNFWHESKFRRDFSHVTVSTPNIIQYDDPSAIVMESNVKIRRFCEIIVIHHSPNSQVAGGLRVGQNTVIGSFANIRAAGGMIDIGKDVLIAQNVCLVASNHIATRDVIHAQAAWDESRTGVTIGDGCWIGNGVTVLPGVSVGPFAVIGAGSVVTKSVPSNEVWGGVPAIRIASLESRSNQS